MAKSLLIRPYVFSAFRTPLLRRSFNCFQARPFVSPSVLEKTHVSSTSNTQIRGVPFHWTKFGSVSHRRFSVGATQVNDSGAIDSPLMKSMEKKIKEQLNADLVIVKDAYGDGRHVSIDVVSSAFEGQSAVNRQRMVYKAIWEELQSTVHAVDQMTTRTPTEASED
ncbi:PREDICTED: protein BOLA4, chloroplastic/mitochondrial [Nelumbo nucifera]|uniref:Protein BOLA4, chloroplastic/mitochondrial n=1 Tax=Nelumbo nucifera TaxID=4432 RepID=A0A1U8AH05_NELNU|nr:PREDICTED: protein BOLA4, chloroplastic/mitochondrial [Nelumbo nucifera]